MRKRSCDIRPPRWMSRAAALALAVALLMTTLLPAAAASQKKAAAGALTEEQKILHLLNRAGFGPRPGDVERVKRMGIERWLDQQLHPEKIDDAALEAKLKSFESLRMEVAELYDKYPQPIEVARRLGITAPMDREMNEGADARRQREQRQKIIAYYAENGLRAPQSLLLELQGQKIVRAVYSERQLQEVMTDFWFNHFNVYWAKGADRWLTTDFEINAIRPHALGKFKDLLMATAKSPAMLFYLDNFQSMAPDAQPFNRRRFGGRRARRNPSATLSDEQQRRLQEFMRRKRGINENYAREIMELHTLGVDGGYTQKDVQEVARALTGWTINQPRQNGRFVFRDWMHDKGEKVVLGQKINAGGIGDGEKVIEILARHPSTARFISTKLARRFVNDDPPASLVERLARVYQKTDGDIREVVRAILTSPEFYAPGNYRAKIKSPFELTASAIRALGGETSGTRQVPQFIARMGQPLYLCQPPTGYPDRAEQWVNTGALLERLNFGLALAANRVIGASVNLPAASGEAAALERAIEMLLHGELSSQTREILNRQLREGVPVKGELGAAAEDGEMAEDAMAAPFGARRRAGRRALAVGPPVAAALPVDPQVAKIFGLVLGSPEFQRR